MSALMMWTATACQQWQRASTRWHLRRLSVESIQHSPVRLTLPMDCGINCSTGTYLLANKSTPARYLQLVTAAVAATTTTDSTTVLIFCLTGHVFWDYSRLGHVLPKITFINCWRRTFYIPDALLVIQKWCKTITFTCFLTNRGCDSSSSSCSSCCCCYCLLLLLLFLL